MPENLVNEVSEERLKIMKILDGTSVLFDPASSVSTDKNELIV